MTPGDPAGSDRLYYWLAYAHPAWMLASLALAGATLRSGLRLRSARRRGARKPAQEYRRHLRLAKPALAMLAAGFGFGLASSLWLRGWDALATAHGLVGSATLALFLATGALGRRLERGASRDAELHGRLALVSVLAAAAAFGTGFVLLP